MIYYALVKFNDFIMNHFSIFFYKELELIRLARDEAQAQAENEAALKEEERKRREELELLKAEYERLLEEEKNAREIENQV